MSEYEILVDELDDIQEQIDDKVNEVRKLITQETELRKNLSRYKQLIYIKYSTRALKRTNPVLLCDIKSIAPEIKSSDMYLVVTTLSGDKFTITKECDVDGKEQYKKIAEHIIAHFEECCGPLVYSIISTNLYIKNFPKALTFMLCNSATLTFPHEIAVTISDKILFFFIFYC